MHVLDNLLGSNLKQTVKQGGRLKIAASCFSIYAYEALKKELSNVESLEFIFTAPTFVTGTVPDKIKKERRKFFIPQIARESSLYGTEFEIQLRNQLTQRAVARECAQWLRRKARFKSNRAQVPMQQFACVESAEASTAYMPLHGFTAVDLGYQKGNAVSNIVNKFEEPEHAKTYVRLFDQIWQDDEILEAVYQENSPERIYFIILYNIFNSSLEELNEDVLPNDRSARKFFTELAAHTDQNNVKYGVVRSYADLMDLVSGGTG